MTKFKKTVMERIREKTTFTSTGCWEWSGGVGDTGYGRLNVSDKWIYLHRYVLEIYCGEELGKKHAHHLCENTICLNPSHLIALTQHQHVLVTLTHPANVNRRKTHCVNGHMLEGNYYRYFQGNNFYRKCKSCSGFNRIISKNNHNLERNESNA